MASLLEKLSEQDDVRVSIHKFVIQDVVSYRIADLILSEGWEQ